MVQIQLSVQNWVSLSQDLREKLRKVFNVQRSTMTVVEDQKLKCDGSTYEDLGVITVEAMQKYLNTKEKDFNELFLAVLDKIIEKENPVEEVKKEVKDDKKEESAKPVETVDKKEEKEEFVGIAPKKRGRPANIK